MIFNLQGSSDAGSEIIHDADGSLSVAGAQMFTDNASSCARLPGRWRGDRQGVFFIWTRSRECIFTLVCMKCITKWNLRVICCRTRDLRSRDGAWRGLARPRREPPLAPTPGAPRHPGLPTLSPSLPSWHPTLLDSCHAQRLAWCWAVRARANPLSLGSS